MTITKKHIDTWFGSYVLMTAPQKEQLRVDFVYCNNGSYEITVWLATKPQNKIFKGWTKIGYTYDDGDQYISIDEMLKTNGYVYLRYYRDKEKINQARLKKWQEFIKNT